MDNLPTETKRRENPTPPNPAAEIEREAERSVAAARDRRKHAGEANALTP